MKVSELARALGISEVQRRDFRNKIKLLAEEGTLVRLRGGRYGLPDEMNLVTGIFNGHPNGYGFLTPKNNDQGGDIYIAPKQTSGAMHQEEISIYPQSKHLAQCIKIRLSFASNHIIVQDVLKVEL